MTWLANAVETGLVETKGPSPRLRAVRGWLFAIAGLVFAMVIVGGATRLTGSGLSITEWQPILGVVPPVSEAAWQEAFEKYRHIPEVQPDQSRHDPPRLQSHLLVSGRAGFWDGSSGWCFSPPSRFSFCAAAFSAEVNTGDRSAFRSRRSAGCAWLVHGKERARRPRGCEPIQARRSSCACRRHCRLCLLACSFHRALNQNREKAPRFEGLPSGQARGQAFSPVLSICRSSQGRLWPV